MKPHLTRWTPAAVLLIAGSTHSLAAGPFGASLELSSLNGANGLVINGIDVLDTSGVAVSSAGDINGDGFNDLVIGAMRADPNGYSSGECYVVFGGVSLGAGGTLELSALNGSNGFVINGINHLDYCGNSVSAAGDVNGDGTDDLLIGASSASPNGQQSSGESYVVFGSVGIATSGTFELSSLSGANGFAINGGNTGDFIGSSVSTAGDFNNDGVDDLIIGADGADPNAMNAGKSYVIFGDASLGASGTLDLATLNGANGFAIIGIDENDYSGLSVSLAGDVNNDGVDDLIIGAFRGDPNGQIDAGEGYVIFGGASAGTSGSLDLSTLNGSNGFVINGIDADDKCSTSVASAGDINNDGVSDLIIGARGGDPNSRSGAGESYILFGNAAIGASGTFELSSLSGSNGFVVNGIDSGDYSGEVSSAGDFNGDGVNDALIGAWAADPNGPASGESYVIFGGASVGASGTFDLSSLSGTNGFHINGIGMYDSCGATVSSVGDINGDGVDDLIIGATGADPSGQYNAGETYVVFGRTDCPGDLNLDAVIDTADLGALLGEFNTPGPNADINGDGVVDTADLGILLANFGTACP